MYFFQAPSQQTLVVKVTSCAIEATSSLNRNATLIRPSLANTHLEKTKQRRKLMHRSRVSAGPQSITGSKADEEMFIHQLITEKTM